MDFTSLLGGGQSSGGPLSSSAESKINFGGGDWTSIAWIVAILAVIVVAVAALKK